MSFNYTFSKSLRLLNKSDFQSMRNGSRFFISNVLIFYIKENDLGYDRIGLAITKKAGNAVQRNKIKRLLRESFRTSQGFSKSRDIVVGMNLRIIKKHKLVFDDFVKLVPESFSKAYSSGFKR